MKKIFSLVAIAAVAATMFTSCKNNDDPTPEKPKAKLTLSVDKPAVEVDAKGAFKVVSDIAAPEAIVISVTSSDAKILTVDPASVTIAKDGKEISGTYTGVAEGKAKIKIVTTTTNVSVTVAEVEVTVGTPPVPTAKIVVGNVGYTTTPTTDNDWASFLLPSSAGENGNFQIGGLWVTSNINGTAGSTFNTVIDNYGQKCYGVVASGKINLSLAEEGVAISTLTLVENAAWSSDNFWECPVVYSDTYTTLAGKSGYAVMYFAFSDPENEIEGVFPGWIKVSVSATGAVTVDDFALMLGDGEFKTGQKQ